jgi:hypothetical protein
MGLLDGLRMAIAPSIAARSGYLAGKEQRRQTQRKESIEDEERKQKSILEQIRAELERSNIKENEARTRWYDQRPRGASEPLVPVVTEEGDLEYARRSQAAGQKAPQPNQMTIGPGGTPVVTPRSSAPGKRPAPNPTNPQTRQPLTKQRADGMWMERQPDGSWEETGVVGAKPGTSSASSASQERLKAQAAYDRGLKDIPRPSKAPESDELIRDPKTGRGIGFKPKTETDAYKKLVKDSTEYERTTMDPLRRHLFDVTVPGVLNEPPPSDAKGAGDQGLGKSAGTPAAAPGAPAQRDLSKAPLTSAEKSPVAANMLKLAGEAYQRDLARGVSPAEALKRYTAAKQRVLAHFGASQPQQ